MLTLAETVMTIQSEHHLQTGGDPRMLADYAALRGEMSKLTHPARPDVDWQHAEKLCLSLFEHNGVELQTAAWYTLARTQRAGLYGMNEGLAILEALLSREWGNLWPQPLHARMEILSNLSKRLQQLMRTLTPTDADLSQLYQVEEHLKMLGDVLQRMELKHAGQLDVLLTLVHNAAVRLENSAHEAVDVDETIIPSTAIDPRERTKWVYVVQPEPQPNIKVMATSPQPTKSWKSFAAGMLTMLIMAGGTVSGWQTMHQPAPAQMKLAATLAPLPIPLNAKQLQVLKEKALPPEWGISQTEQQLARLAQLKPDWAVRYGDALVQQAFTLWPEQAKLLAAQWQQQITTQALSVDSLNGWHQGMAQLQQLANRLNALDEKRGKYMTVSELKSAVFAMTQSFNRTIPAEEQLRQLSVLPEGQPWPAAQQSQTEQHLQQLSVRYALLKQKTVE